MSRYDIVIIGAGPVGLATAALIANGSAAQRVRIRIVDGGEPPHWDATETDLRVYALSKAAEGILADAGALPRIRARRMSACETMQVWEGNTLDSAGRLCFDSADIGEPNLGHIVEDNLIRVALLEALADAKNVEFEFGRKLAGVDIGERCVDVALAGDAAPRSGSLLIGADGGRSQVRDAARLPGFERDYRQQAIVAHIVPDRGHRRTAWQRFLPGGPLALLPLADGRCSIVWSLPNTVAAQLIEIAPQEFEQRLTYASGQVLGGLRLDSPRLSLPLFARHAQRYCRPRLALVGDAAHSVHPLAGQGVNLGLADAAELACQISAALAAGQDPGDLRVLRRYERARTGPNMLMLGALDGMDRLFRASRALSPIRAAGLNLVDRIPLLRQRLIRHASGEPLCSR